MASIGSKRFEMQLPFSRYSESEQSGYFDRNQKQSHSDTQMQMNEIFILDSVLEHQFSLDLVESAMNHPIVSFRKNEPFKSEQDDSECSCTLPPPTKFPPRSRRLQLIGCESTSAKANVTGTSSKSDTLAYKRIYRKKIGEMIALNESANWSSHEDDQHQTLPDND